MRGAFEDQGGLFSYISPEARIPARHPLRKIRELVREVLGELNRSLGKLYASEGRPRTTQRVLGYGNATAVARMRRVYLLSS